MTKLKYLGPVSILTLVPDETDETGKVKKKGKTIQLITGQSYDDLPENHTTVKALRARKLLIVDKSKTPKKAASPEPDAKLAK